MEASSEKVKINTYLIRDFLSNDKRGASTINKHKLVLTLFVAVGIIVITAIVISFNYNYYKFNDTSSSLSSLAQQQKISQTITEQPSLLGPGKNTLKVENFVAPGSLSSPTSMAFIDASNLLVLQKDGQLRLISNGILQRKPILTIQVDMQANVDY